MKDYTGHFISFDGVDGTGKSTLVSALYDKLTSKGFKVSITREPGGSELAEKIRNLILSEEMDPLTETMLFHAARYDHYTTTILPLLKEGYIVITDRFSDSSFVYQGYAKCQYTPVVILDRLINSPRADISFIVTASASIIEERITSRDTLNRFDKDVLTNIKELDDEFRKISKYSVSKHLIDNSSSLEATLNTILNILKESNVINT